MSNQQSEVPLPARQLLRRLKAALGFLPRPLPKEVEAIDFVLIDRATMSVLHFQFLGDPDETDVITFPYGEIVICPEVALRQAVEHRMAVEDEVLLYGLHGLLHLAGYDDRNEKAAAVMEREQSKLLKRVLQV